MMAKKRGRGKRLSLVELNERLNAYITTTSDIEASEKLGMKVPAFTAWREGKKLPAQGEALTQRLTVRVSKAQLRTLEDAANGQDLGVFVRGWIDGSLSE